MDKRKRSLRLLSDLALAEFHVSLITLLFLTQATISKMTFLEWAPFSTGKKNIIFGKETLFSCVNNDDYYIQDRLRQL